MKCGKPVPILQRVLQAKTEAKLAPAKDEPKPSPKETPSPDFQFYSRFCPEQKRPYDAIGCLKQGLSIQSEHLELVFALAELYQEIGQYSDAIVCYEKAIKLAPADKICSEVARQRSR